MRTMVMAATLTVTFAAAWAPAQQTDPPRAPADGDETTRAEPLHTIRVLENPYDIASYYRSRQGSGFFAGSSERHPIASFYRSRQSSPYGQFWAMGYGARDRRGSFRRSIGENGELFLFAPVVLGPIGPLSGAFTDQR